MSARYFLDTNILVYAIEGIDRAKATIADRLIRDAITTGRGCISTQVVNECLNVTVQKAKRPISHADALDLLRTTLEPLCVVPPTGCDLHRRALDLRHRYKYSFYDSLIVAAALHAKCKFLYSEDLQHGQRIEATEIVNPFI